MEENDIFANSLKEQANEIFNTKAKDNKKVKNVEERQNRIEDDLRLNEDEDRNNDCSEKDMENQNKKEKKQVCKF